MDTAGLQRYACCRTPQPPVIDGRLDDAVWRTTRPTSDFVDIEGPAKPTPRYATRAWMLWDDENLYIAAWLEEPNVRASLTHHDDIVFHDNDFEAFLDPDGDARAYVEIEINALGTVFDLLLERTYHDGGPARHEWNVQGLNTAVFIDGTLNDDTDKDRGWSLELAVPWTALRPFSKTACPPRLGDVWRVNFSRVQWPDGVQGGPALVNQGIEANWVWSPQDAVDMHIPQRWGRVVFSGEAAGSHP